MQLIKKKKIDIEKKLSDEEIKKDAKSLKINRLITGILGIAGFAYFKYDNLVLDTGLSLKQQILDNVALMLMKMGNEPIISNILILSLIYFAGECGLYKERLIFKNQIRENRKEGKLKLTEKAELRKIAIKKKLSSIGSVVLAALGYLATAKNIAVDVSSHNVFSCIAEDAFWAIEGAIEEPIIFSTFMIPAIVLWRYSKQKDVEEVVSKWQNKLLNRNKNRLVGESSKNPAALSKGKIIKTDNKGEEK